MRRFRGITGELGKKSGRGSAPLSCELASCFIALVVGLAFQASRIVDPSSFSWMTEHGSVLLADDPSTGRRWLAPWLGWLVRCCCPVPTTVVSATASAQVATLWMMSSIASLAGRSLMNSSARPWMPTDLSKGLSLGPNALERVTRKNFFHGEKEIID